MKYLIHIPKSIPKLLIFIDISSLSTVRRYQNPAKIAGFFIYKKRLVIFQTNLQIVIYLSVVSINKALQGEPSAPDKFNGAAFKK